MRPVGNPIAPNATSVAVRIVQASDDTESASAEIGADSFLPVHAMGWGV